MRKGHFIKKCAVCEGALKSHYPKVRDPLTKETFAIYRCSSCGLGHTVPQPEDLSPYYSSGYYGNRHGFTLWYCIRRRLRLVNSIMPQGTSQKKLLDVGCGDGSFLLAAREAGWAVTGTEINPQPARSAGLDVKEALHEIPSTASFDCVTMWHTLEHMRDIKSTLNYIGKLLNSDGKLIVAVPDNGGFQAKIFRHKWLHVDDPRHLYHFDAGSLQHSLASTGFTIERQWHQEFEYDLIGWAQSGLNSIMDYPNVFFDYLTGKRKDYSKSIILSSFVLGSLFTVLALPAVAAGRLLGRGGTLIAVARRCQ